MALPSGLYDQNKEEEDLPGLTRNQALVLKMLKDNANITQMAIADQIGVTRQRINQIVNALLDKGYDQHIPEHIKRRRR